MISDLISTDDIQLLISDELGIEAFTVLYRPKFEKWATTKNIALLLKIFKSAEKINPLSDIKLCLDPKDDYLLNLAVDGDADFLFTGDYDLLVLKRIEKTEITTFSKFIKQHIEQ